jgi:hypothetical protein
MRKRREIRARSLVVLVVSVLSARAFASDGPSLAVTLQFVVDKINAQGTVHYNSMTWNPLDNHEMPAEDERRAFTNARATISPCMIAWHYRYEDNGALRDDVEVPFPINNIDSIRITTLAELTNQLKRSEPNHVYAPLRTVPEIYHLEIVPRKGNGAFLEFTDASDARRVSAALTHAAELCGGGVSLFDVPNQPLSNGARPSIPQVYQSPAPAPAPQYDAAAAAQAQQNQLFRNVQAEQQQKQQELAREKAQQDANFAAARASDNRRYCIQSCFQSVYGVPKQACDVQCVSAQKIQYEQCAIYTCGGDPAAFNNGHYDS